MCECGFTGRNPIGMLLRFSAAPASGHHIFYMDNGMRDCTSEMFANGIILVNVVLTTTQMDINIKHLRMIELRNKIISFSMSV